MVFFIISHSTYESFETNFKIVLFNFKERFVTWYFLLYFLSGLSECVKVLLDK